MPNVNDRESVKLEYTEADHLRLLVPGDGDIAGIVTITDSADDDGDFKLECGFRHPPNEFSIGFRLPVQGEYVDMVDWIISVAETGNL